MSVFFAQLSNKISGRKLDLEKVILSDFVLRKQNARAPCAAPPVGMRSKWSVRDRRMHRAASSFASMATEDRSKITRSFSPIQGTLIKLNNYHSQGMSKAQAAECRRARSPENRLQPPSAKHERRGGSPAAAGRFFGEKAPPQFAFCEMPAKL